MFSCIVSGSAQNVKPSERHGLCRNAVAEHTVVLDENDRRLEFQQQFLKLNAREHVPILSGDAMLICAYRLLSRCDGSHRLRASRTFFFCPAEKSAMSFSNCTRAKSSLRKIALNRLSSNSCCAA